MGEAGILGVAVTDDPGAAVEGPWGLQCPPPASQPASARPLASPHFSTLDC